MATYVDREYFIPLQLKDLIDFLVDGKAAKTPTRTLAGAEGTQFRQFAELVQSHYHRSFHQKFRDLKESYGHFDPDTDTPSLSPLPADQRDAYLKNLYQEVKNLMLKANYRELTKEQAIATMQGASLWGLEMDVCWDVFDHIEIFYRGDTTGVRTIRRWWKLWMKEELVVPEFNRLVVILKQRPHSRLGHSADTKSVYLKMFKDMPKPDMEMVLPGTRVMLSSLDKGMIFYPVFSGLAIVLYKVLADLIGFKDIFALGTAVSLSWSLAAAFAGYSYKSYVSYSNKKTSYTLQLTQSLYYQGIDSNAGVFHRVLQEAEEQESREVILCYFYLLKVGGPNGLTDRELDDLIERELEDRLGIKVDFEIADAIYKLEALQLVRKEGDRYRAVSLEQAVRAVEQSNTQSSPKSSGWSLLDRLAGKIT
ncbi:DUF3754 domain-containing protein [Zavarzinella formosa]|uniref:DUF3754 domain-containing protein n=1 Tax=Zavarzinella formosa TaxID=360055 RepID=UPI0003153AC3|nr:DUF3754 domain-containing protein [Zavarzinella formosa]